MGFGEKIHIFSEAKITENVMRQKSRIAKEVYCYGNQNYFPECSPGEPFKICEEVEVTDEVSDKNR